MSTATTRPSGPGAAIDHGLVPSTFSRPPHGAMAGLALVVRTATQPSCAARRVQYIAVPKWLELRTPTAPTPCLRARSTAVVRACSVSTWPMPSRPSRSTSGPVSESTTGSLRALIAPERSRAAYQGRRSTPCDWCPQRSACTRLSATSAASSSGTPWRVSTCAANVRRWSGDRRDTGPPLDDVRRSVYSLCTATREDGDVQPGGADGGPAGPARGVPRRHGGQRGGLGTGRAGLPAVRHLLGGRRREPLRPVRALHRRRGVRRPQG